jgi:hypothetical protein
MEVNLESWWFFMEAILSASIAHLGFRGGFIGGGSAAIGSSGQ